MAKVTRSHVSVKVDARIALELTETEARALDGIFGYNVDAFLQSFYKIMGKAYVEPYEDGVRSLHETIRTAVGGPLRHVDDARRLIRNAQELEREAIEERNQPKPQKPRIRVKTAKTA